MGGTEIAAGDWVEARGRGAAAVLVPDPRWHVARQDVTKTAFSMEHAPTPHHPDFRADGLSVSVVIAAYNEEENIVPLEREIAEVMDPVTPGGWELVFVDDGSTDGTWERIGAVAASLPNVRGLRFSRNFGHQPALLAGMMAAGGEAVITMDADLQHPPGLLPDLIARWRAGYEIVKTRRLPVPGEGIFKRWTSAVFYRVFSVLSGVPLREGSADFRLLDRRALDEILRFPEEGLFLRGVTEWIGFRSCTIPYTPRRRASGRSGYGMVKMVRLALRGVCAFSVMPLRIGIFIGLTGSVLSAAGVAYAIIGKLFDRGTIPGWASTLLVMSLLFFLLFLYLGILGEYLGRVVIETRRRPRFIVAERVPEPERRNRP